VITTAPVDAKVYPWTNSWRMDGRYSCLVIQPNNTTNSSIVSWSVMSGLITRPDVI